MVYMYVSAFWFHLQTKSLAYNLSEINKGKENERKLKNISFHIVRHEPTISALTSTRSVHKANRDSGGQMIRKNNLKPKPFVMSGNLKFV